MNILLGSIIALGGLGALLYANNWLRLNHWRRQATHHGQTISLGGRRQFYRLNSLPDTFLSDG